MSAGGILKAVVSGGGSALREPAGHARAPVHRVPLKDGAHILDEVGKVLPRQGSDGCPIPGDA